MIDQTFDLVVIGAGPAGMAGALEAAKHKLSVLVLDEQPEEGGQIFRSISTTERLRPEIFAMLGNDYQSGKKLLFSFQQAGVKYLSGATVWLVEADKSVYFLQNGIAHQVQAKRLLIATGAQERPVPIPGWTLPGVMGAAAADVLLKSSGAVPSGRVVFAGSGPLMWLAASRFAETEVKILAVLETVNFSNYLQALPYLPQALRASEYLIKGLRIKMQLRKAGIPVLSDVHNLRVEGAKGLEKLYFTHRGNSKSLELDTLLLHEGVIPNTKLTQQLGCDHDWHELQSYWHPLLDQWGNTSVKGVAVAGDCGIVAGALTSEASGHLAALESTFQLGKISQKQRDAAAHPFRKEINHHKAVRPFLEHLYRPNPKILVPQDDSTLVCRCEEVTAGFVRQAVKFGALDLNRVKAYTRCGMGQCQGRMCELTAAEIIAEAQEKSPREVGYFRCRPPLKPITLGQLAGLEKKIKAS